MIRLMEDINLQNYTLILPSVAVGNVGQLSVDLLISNLNLQKIGQIFSPAFVPIVGANAYHEGSSELITAIDIYVGVKECVVVLQIRSPYVGELTGFFDHLVRFVIERKIAKVIILASSYDYEKRDIQPQHLKLRYVASSGIQSENGQLFDDLSWISHKPKVTSDTRQEGKLQIPGGGFAKSIFNFLSHADIPCAILFKFCSEGDNIADAVALVCYLNQWIRVLGTNSDNLKYPPSWKHLFGKPPPHNIY
ncbi:Proteasome assembly chaperone 2 [Camponotus floridanus]|uniref:Proteasome assembly chaperone 2 n=1 Tax=Camponotus floridanus TaxID=104421 RepID=E2A7M8_CAMFO|nr:proteasome assembly chaperone 2 [Camponotus floridanus]EFN70549.1 Proteasome assembly chaperone 2 [Camponotus floridanus]